MLSLHLAIFQSLGSEALLFGLSLVLLSWLTESTNALHKLTRPNAITILTGCLLISIPLHNAIPDRFRNPFCGPIGILMQLPVLSMLSIAYYRKAPTPPGPIDQDGG